MTLYISTIQMKASIWSGISKSSLAGYKIKTDWKAQGDPMRILHLLLFLTLRKVGAMISYFGAHTGMKVKDVHCFSIFRCVDYVKFFTALTEQNKPDACCARSWTC